MSEQKEALDSFIDEWTQGVDVYEDMPSFPKVIYEDLMKMLPFHQPEYALGCALLASSILVGPLVEHSRIRGNLYGLLVGPTATGKSYALSLLEKLFREVDRGWTYTKSLSSIHGLVRRMQKGDGKTLLMLDDATEEYFRVKKKQPSLGSWQGQTHAGLRRLWKENDEFELPPTADGDVMSVKRPYFSMLGTLIPYASSPAKTLSADLLRKALIFEGSLNFHGFREGKQNWDSWRVSEVNRALDMRPREVDFLYGNENLWEKFHNHIHELIEAFERHAFLEVIAEAPIHMMKVALCVCKMERSYNGFWIKQETFRWAAAVVALNLKKQYRLLVKEPVLSASLQERVWKRIHKVCVEEGQMRHGDLLRRCAGLGRKDRNMILDDLEAQKLIILSSGQTRGKIIKLTEHGKRRKVA